MAPSDPPRVLSPRSDLDALVVNLELTLISIIQGVALSFLVEGLRDVLVPLRWESVPYGLAGLCIILLWWTRGVLHTLTVIAWPIDFAHNFLYVASALAESLMFTQLASPAHWYGFGILFSGLLWWLFAADLRLIRERIAEHRHPVYRELLGIILREQKRQIAIAMPAATAFYAASTLAIGAAPGFFLDRGGHVWIALVQLGAASAYVVYVLRYFRRIAGLLLRSRQEEIA